jgi:hypothetical protein
MITPKKAIKSTGEPKAPYPEFTFKTTGSCLPRARKEEFSSHTTPTLHGRSRSMNLQAGGKPSASIDYRGFLGASSPLNPSSDVATNGPTPCNPLTKKKACNVKKKIK